MSDAVLRSFAERWERQQEVYLPHREERFAIMFKLLERLLDVDAGPLTILDLACGTGSISRRVLRVFPGAHVLAVDFDPSLLAIARANLGDAGGRLSFYERDLREPTWLAGLPINQVDAVLSATALHWLSPANLVAVYTALATLLRPGGILVNMDLLPTMELSPRLHQAVLALDRAESSQAAAAGQGEDWEQWWAAARVEPALAELVAERDRRFEKKGGHTVASLTFQQDALRSVGFAEVGEVFRYWRDAMIVAVR